jgi:hypothetical protein
MQVHFFGTFKYDDKTFFLLHSADATGVLLLQMRMQNMIHSSSPPFVAKISLEGIYMICLSKLAHML